MSMPQVEAIDEVIPHSAPGVPSLEFKGVSKSFGTGAQRTIVLKDINLQI